MKAVTMVATMAEKTRKGKDNGINIDVCVSVRIYSSIRDEDATSWQA